MTGRNLHAGTEKELRREGKPHKVRKPSGYDAWVKYMKDLSSGKLKRDPNHKAEAEKLVKAAERAEKKGDHARASVLHEKAGDLFCLCRMGDAYGPLVAPAGSGTVLVDSFHAALPEMESTTGRTMYEEAIGQYRRAADLVRKTDPKRAAMLERRIGSTGCELRDEEDGITPDD